MDCSTFDSLLQDALHLEGLCIKHGVEFVGIGPTIDPHIIEWIPKLIAGTKYIFCSFATPHNMELTLALELGAAILDVAALTGGIGSFRFAVLSNMQHGCPFYPAAYHPGDVDEPLFGLATENTPILRQAMEASQGSLELATKMLTTYLQRAFDPVLQIAEALGTVTVETKSGATQDQHPRFLGIDASVAPGPGTPTITGSYELLGLGRFGDPGTLAVTSAITSALKLLSVPLIGYSGLMLPVCEDKGLAQRADEGVYTMGDLIKYSAVCGCGLDTVPISGSTTRPASLPHPSGALSTLRQRLSYTDPPSMDADKEPLLTPPPCGASIPHGE
ncbi:hypothetical protein CYMTET_39124 [Cymbomonas tetramitiformis]|uniref:DUF711 family protein n=1 Tax=Cymbomonas tetramitiformis TaxID=36881 RepID=A0AAE0CCR8_9CHLO|nr:hypothetical protein CYMTET_39124 [Cymbomonas tetramitiformis]